MLTPGGRARSDLAKWIWLPAVQGCVGHGPCAADARRVAASARTKCWVDYGGFWYYSQGLTQRLNPDMPAARWLRTARPACNTRKAAAAGEP